SVGRELGANLTVVQFDDLAADVQAEPQSGSVVLVVCAEETSKQTLEHLGSNANSIIAYRELHRSCIRCCDLDSDDAAVGTVLHGVIDKVGEHLLDTQCIHFGDNCRVCVQLERMAACLRLSRFQHTLNKRTQVNCFAIDLELPGLEAGNVQQLRHESSQLLRLLPHTLEHLM